MSGPAYGSGVSDRFCAVAQMSVRGLVCVAVFLAAGCAGGVSSGSGSTTVASEPTTSALATTSPTTSTRPSDAVRSPVWPEGSTSAVVAAIPRLQAGLDPWRASPESTVQMFARDVLGWVAPQVEPDHTKVGQGSGVWYRLIGGSRGNSASIEVIPLTDQRRWWAVAYARLAGGDDENFNVSVQVSGNRATVSAAQGWWTNDVASAELRIGHGLGERVLVAKTPPARWLDIELPALPSDSGHLVLIFRSADGQAVALLATSLPKGEFAAS